MTFTYPVYLAAWKPQYFTPYFADVSLHRLIAEYVNKEICSLPCTGHQTAMPMRWMR